MNQKRIDKIGVAAVIDYFCRMGHIDPHINFDDKIPVNTSLISLNTTLLELLLCNNLLIFLVLSSNCTLICLPPSYDTNTCNYLSNSLNNSEKICSHVYIIIQFRLLQLIRKFFNYFLTLFLSSV